MKQISLKNVSRMCIVALSLCMMFTNSQKKDQNQNRDQLMSTVIQQTINLAEIAQKSLTTKCSDKCTPNFCSGFGSLEKYAEECAGTEECNNCHMHEQSLTQSLAIFNAIDSNDIKDIDYFQRKTLCQSLQLDAHFQELHQLSNPAWIYISYEYGIIKIFPGIPTLSTYFEQEDEEDQKCRILDVRNRPWYAAATTGPKQLIIIMDISYWMTNTIKNEELNSTETYWDYSKKMLDDVLLSLTPLDYVCVVLYNRTSAFSIGQPPPATNFMGQSTKEMLDFIKQEIALIDPSTHENDDTPASYHGAIDLSYSILADITQLYSIQEPNPVMLLISGKDDCSATSNGSYHCNKIFWQDEQPPDPSYILDIVKSYNTRILDTIGVVPRFFTFSIDPNGENNHAVSRMLACSGNAAWTKISGLQAVRRTMRPFRYLLSRYISNNKNKVSWSHIYEDNFGLCNMTTASKAIFDSKGVLQGVLGLDVCIEKLNVTQENYLEKLKSYFIEDNIDPPSLDQCDLQITRSLVFTDNLKSELEQAQAIQYGQCPDLTETTTCYQSIQGEDQVFYYIGETKSDWQSASEDCEATGGTLVSISDQQTAGEVVGLLDYSNYWIGLKGKGPWQWSDSSVSDATENEPWWLWSEQVQNGNEEHCGYINRQGIINSVGLNECSKKMKYICQYSEKPSVCGDGIVEQLSNEEVWESGQGVPPLQFCIDKRETDNEDDLTDYNVPEKALCDIDKLHEGELPIQLECCDKIPAQYIGQYGDQCIQEKPKKSSKLGIILGVVLSIVIVVAIAAGLFVYRYRGRKIHQSEALLN